jgi:carbamoylphosphate synthase large subunit
MSLHSLNEDSILWSTDPTRPLISWEHASECYDLEMNHSWIVLPYSSQGEKILQLEIMLTATYQTIITCARKEIRPQDITAINLSTTKNTAC